MKGLIIDCEVPYFATFRKPSSTSLMLTYPIPPFTTVRGMIANALGLQQHDHSLQDQIKMGMRIVQPGYKNVELAKILKLKESPGGQIRAYPSSPMFKEYLVNPRFEFFIAGEKDIIERIQTALVLPQRPLYMGQSDDLAVYEPSNILDIREIELETFDSAV
jgi:CRISPR-associated protein Cas5h